MALTRGGGERAGGGRGGGCLSACAGEGCGGLWYGRGRGTLLRLRGVEGLREGEKGVGEMGGDGR